MGTQRYIQNIEEQEFILAINGKTFNFRIFPFRGLMYIDVAQDEMAVLTAKRLMANQWILPDYVAEGVGNIRFETYEADGDDYVWYDVFNTKFRLVSYTDAELKEMKAETSTSI